MQSLFTLLIALGLFCLAWQCQRFALKTARRIARLRQDLDYQVSCINDHLHRLADPSDAINEWDKRIRERERAFYSQVAKIEADIRSLKASPEYRSRQAERDAVSKLKARF